MTIEQLSDGQTQRLWPTVDEAIQQGATGKDLEFAIDTQPEALATRMTQAVDRLYWALDAVGGMTGMYMNPVALQNALNELPEEKAELLRRQMSLSDTLWGIKHPAEGEDKAVEATTTPMTVTDLADACGSLMLAAADVKWGQKLKPADKYLK